MPAKLVPTIRTSYTQPQMIKAFVEAWKNLYGVIPKKESVGVIWAQNALETGTTKSMWNNNIGNVKYVANVSDTEATEYCMLANIWEMINGKKVIFQPPSPATWFRSFSTLSLGVTYHFNFLKNNRYKDAWTAVEKGDCPLFSHLLKIKGYYTAPEADYTKAMMYYYNQYMYSKDYENAVQSLTPPPPELQTGEPHPPITELPPDHQPINTVPDNSSGERIPVVVTTLQKFKIVLYNFLSAMPWIRLIEYLVKLGKK